MTTDPTPTRAADVPIDGLLAIARWHREHERFHSMNALQDAAGLRRDANALKVLARRWQEADGPDQPRFDATDPLFQAAGCDDLNDTAGVATTGILFMEGEAEPAELAQMKRKLADLAAGWKQTSVWLAEKLEPAWQRESALFTHTLAAAARPRFATLTRTSRAGVTLGLVARLLEAAVSALAARPLLPDVIRGDLPGSAHLLLAVSWLLDEASATLAEMAADLSRTDPDWTAYLDILDRQTASG